jgi:hypothetical protein
MKIYPVRLLLDHVDMRASAIGALGQPSLPELTATLASLRQSFRCQGSSLGPEGPVALVAPIDLELGIITEIDGERVAAIIALELCAHGLPFLCVQGYHKGALIGFLGNLCQARPLL